MQPTVLIVEDHPLYRDALVALVRGLVGVSGTVAVSSAEEGLRMGTQLPGLRLVILDLGLPGIQGVEAIHAFGRHCPTVPVVVVSAVDERQQAHAVLRAGARVFLSKAVSTQTIVETCRRVLSGALDSPHWVSIHGEMRWSDVDTLKLSPRQQDTLSLLSEGHSNKEIGLRLGLAEITVKMHVSALFRLLGVINRTQAVLAARRLGLGSYAMLPGESP